MNNKDIKNYKIYKEKIGEIIENCMLYTYNFKLEEKFYNLLNNNNVRFDFNDTNVVINLTVFHRVSKEDTIFEKYMKEYIGLFHNDYKYYNAIKNTYVESLFEIKNIDNKNNIVTLLDMYTNKEYNVTDITLSNSSKDLIGSYIYTSLVTINEFTIITEYGFVFLKNNHPNILREIKIKTNRLNINNDVTKRFIACYKMFQKEDDISFYLNELV